MGTPIFEECLRRPNTDSDQHTSSSEMILDISVVMDLCGAVELRPMDVSILGGAVEHIAR
jgi:hypothetical protein